LARLSRYDKILILLFVFSLPLVNPWVRGDGVGYYAFGRALLVQHNLDFKQDWLRANSSFRLGRTDAAGISYRRSTQPPAISITIFGLAASDWLILPEPKETPVASTVREPK
jgi:hypothetical protein